MTIDEIRALKAEAAGRMQIQIDVALKEFSARTGMLPDDVSVRLLEVMCPDGTRQMISSVSIELERI